jgi:hypothetical protein
MTTGGKGKKGNMSFCLDAERAAINAGHRLACERICLASHPIGVGRTR